MCPAHTFTHILKREQFPTLEMDTIPLQSIGILPTSLNYQPIGSTNVAITW